MNTGEATRYELFPFIKDNLQEYLFALQPDEISGRLLTGQRQQLQQEYGGDGLAGGSFNIPVMQFVGSEQMEERIIRWIQRLCANESSFSLPGSIVDAPAKQSILLSIGKETAWHRFVQRLRVVDDIMAAENCPPMQEVAHPCLSLAEKLSPDATKGYHGRAAIIPLVINGLILWNRPHEYSPWKMVNVFHLSPV